MSQLARQMQMVDIYPTNGGDSWNSLSDSTVMQKYQSAGAFSNEALRLVLQNCVAGATIADLCKLGDDFILEQTSKVFTKGNIERGIAFPTCISVNNIVSNYSPMQADSQLLKSGDVVKVELGVHIDGYVCTQAHTLVLNPNPVEPVTGKKADVICAAYIAAEAAVRLVKSGVESSEILQAVNSVARDFGVTPVDATASHAMKRFLLESEQAIPNSFDASSTDFVFGDHDVISINIVLSTGQGLAAESAIHDTTVFQRDVSASQGFKLKASRNAFNTIAKSFGVFPFSSRALFDIDAGHKLGLPEVLKSGVVVGRPVFMEDEGEFVAQFKITVMVLPNNGGSLRLSAPLNPPFVHSVRNADSRIEALLKQDIKIAKAKVPVSNIAGMDVS